MDRRRTVRWLRQVTPPVFADAYRALRARPPRAHDWQYLPDGWPLPLEGAAGWDHPSVAQAQLALWPTVLARAAGPEPIGGGSDGDEPIHHALQGTILAFAYVVGRAAMGTGRLSILDWGGGAGQYAAYARGLYPSLELEYHCRELPGLAAVGRKLLPDGSFHHVDDSALGRRYDLVMASGSLQYIRDWSDCLARLAIASTSYLYVARLPVVANAESFVALQRPRAIGYLADFPSWFLNRDSFLRHAEGIGLRLEREFNHDEPIMITGAPASPRMRAFLFSVEGRDARVKKDDGSG